MKETNIATASLPQQCRPAVKELLKEIYGYTDFRDFEVYNDLSSGKDNTKIHTECISQNVFCSKISGHWSLLRLSFVKPDRKEPPLSSRQAWEPDDKTTCSEEYIVPPE